MTTLGLLIGTLPLARTQRHLARLLAQSAPAGTHLIELVPHDLPYHAPYSDVPAPAGAQAWRRSVAAVDGLVILTPTIERSVPGALKNALDWAGSSTLAGMPTAIAGVSIGGLPRFAPLQHLRTVLADRNAAVRSQPETVLFAAPEAFDVDGTAIDQDLVAEARDLLSAAAGLAAHERRAQGAPASDAADGAATEVLAAIAAAGPAPASPASGVPVAPAVTPAA
ncbi:NADPH-dependent FMN reductase [Demequina sp. NBRC 110053]|uniref:NADPH-dependent FMN reductase n=1 Tax=Demequina sp. NBRC 110053 TaxID=1570342 RepID=UPI000A053458|nr:NADPH-dependent FMN reductase [Demequina sp. NBRC 110053]